MAEEAEASPLLHLLSAPSKQAVDDFLCSCAREMDTAGGPTAARLAELTTAFGITSANAKALRKAGIALVRGAIYASASSAEQVVPLLGEDFHTDLAALLTRVITHRVGEWKAESLTTGGVSTMPRLEQASWQVYRKPGTPSPSLLLSLALQGAPSDSKVNIEMSKEQLETMLQSLSKVKEQLDNV